MKEVQHPSRGWPTRFRPLPANTEPPPCPLVSAVSHFHLPGQIRGLDPSRSEAPSPYAKEAMREEQRLGILVALDTS